MENSDMQAVIDAARLGMPAQELESSDTVSHYFLPHPSEPRVFQINTEAGNNNPYRKRGRVQVFDAASFNAIIADNPAAGNIAVYVNRDPDAPCIQAVLNGSGLLGPGWGDYRAEIIFRFTPQWKKWRAMDGKMLPQVTFAEFVEDNLGDITDPAGAEILEIAQYLSATRSVDFKSAVRLSDGRVQFQNIESLDAKVGAGETSVPQTLTLAISPVFGLRPVKITARFRYRIEAGKLLLGIKMQRIEDIMADVVQSMASGIAVPAGAIMVEGIAPDVTK